MKKSHNKRVWKFPAFRINNVLMYFYAKWPPYFNIFDRKTRSFNNFFFHHILKVFVQNFFQLDLCKSNSYSSRYPPFNKSSE